MKRVAVIDLGTNTFNLIIAEIEGGREFRKVFSYRIPVMLGEGSINSGIIGDAPFKRGIDALKKMKEEIDRYEAHEVRALATSAIRTAKNGKDFIAEAKRLTRIEIEIITGEREAELIFLGNSLAAGLDEHNSLIMDIGGGSTEFIIANRKNMLWAHSFLLGAARLLGKFNPEDPIENGTIKKIEAYFEQELQPLFEAVGTYPVSELIGSSGAFDSFAELIDVKYNSMQFSEEKISYSYDLAQYYEIGKKIIASTYNERIAMDGLIPMRVEMIVVSFLFVNFVLRRLNITQMRSTTWSLKEGAIVEMIRSHV
jgi:exopolyphosphatase / guanosine-5'-triphosphate,3'-diphosphate pyrophosphatase